MDVGWCFEMSVGGGRFLPEKARGHLQQKIVICYLLKQQKKIKQSPKSTFGELLNAKKKKRKTERQREGEIDRRNGNGREALTIRQSAG